MKDFDYYSGRDIQWPVKPTKPVLDKANTTAEGVRKYADMLEEYEKSLATYKEQRKDCENEQNKRLKEFKKDLEKEYASDWMDQRVLDLVYNRAWDESHHSGLHEVVDAYSENC